MYYTQWSSTDYHDSDSELTTSVSYGPSGTIDAYTYHVADFEQTLRVRMAWPGGTSTALQTATRYTEATDKATERDSNGNITNVNIINGDADETLLAPFGGGTTANTSYPVTYRPTETASFRMTYATVGSGTDTTVLTATAAATREGTGTATSSLSGLTTVSQFATGVSGLWFSNVRENPEFNGVNEFYRNFGRTAGEGEAAIGRRVAAAFSGGASAGTHAVTQSIAADSAVQAFLAATLSVSAAPPEGAIIAKRKILSVANTSDVIFMSTGTDASFYTASSAANSELTNIPSLLVPIFRQGGFFNNPNVGTNLMTPRIFTNPESGFSISSSSATANWSYQSSSWILYTTLANTSTSTNGSTQISFSGAAQTDTMTADAEVGFVNLQVGANRIPAAGQTQGHVGPAIPLTISGLNEISVSSIGGFISSSQFFLRTQACTTGAGSVTATSRTGVFGTAVSSFPGSSSTVVAFGTAASARQVATYANTLLTAAVGVPALIIVTRTLAGWSAVGGEPPPHPVAVSARKADKWNEAGQGNRVSVRGLPAASTAFL